MSDSKKCLLFCPSFFSYDNEIKLAIERLGYTVTLHDERPFHGVVGKSLVRLGFNSVVKKLIDKYYRNIFNEIEEHYELLLIVNPECFSPELISLYRKKCSRVVIYMWDSFQNKKNAYKLISHTDVFFTFDPCDAEKYNIKFKPLFYVPDYISVPADGSELYDVSFIGTAHSSRFKLVNNIAKGYRSYLFFYCPNKIVFLMKKYILNELCGMKVRDVAFTSLNRKCLVEVLKSSKASIDVAHPKQQGVTMRTIESIGCQRKLITTNKNVVNYDFYNKSNILVIDDKTNDQVVSGFLASDYIPLSKEIYSKYFIDNWLYDILEEVTEHG